MKKSILKVTVILKDINNNSKSHVKTNFNTKVIRNNLDLAFCWEFIRDTARLVSLLEKGSTSEMLLQRKSQVFYVEHETRPVLKITNSRYVPVKSGDLQTS